jgi:hypothetical protein
MCPPPVLDDSTQKVSSSIVSTPEKTLIVSDLEQTPYIVSGLDYYLLPTQLETINCEFDIKKLQAAKKLLEKQTKSFDRVALLKGLHDIFKVSALTEIVYKDKAYALNYQELRNRLFETLYTLYILRRRTSINLEYIIAGLQTLHTLEILAADDFLNSIKSAQLDPNNKIVQDMAKFLSYMFEELQDINFLATTNNFFFINNAEDLSGYLQSTPIIHPIFARLCWYKKPFNKIKPIGIGDLKVVKQWLCGYKAGEISHIHNIMKSEIKERTHRHLEKTEDVFSFSSEQSENTQHESQSTDRFEMKREAEKAIKTDLNIGANANFTYNNPTYGITTSVGATFAYANSNQDTQRSSSNYAREIMDKAVSQVQNKATQNRSSTKIFETEETNKHGFDNTKAGATHISGIYRWLDKRYKAQLHNYGERLMFEFIIPEPAAFYVESKLRGFDFELDCPTKPNPPDFEEVKLDFTPQEITPEKFNELQLQYDLSNIPNFPVVQTKELLFSDPTSGLAFIDKGEANSPYSRNWRCTLRDKNYEVVGVIFRGIIYYHEKALPPVEGEEGNPDSFRYNVLQVSLNRKLILDQVHKQFIDVTINDSYDNSIPHKDFPDFPIDVASGEIEIDIYAKDMKSFAISIEVTLVPSEGALFEWQKKVHKTIRTIEKAKLEKINEEKRVAYFSQMTEFRQRLSELKTTIINDIIQGRSEAFNKQIINTELKKHCLTLITKEFDKDVSNDILNKINAIETNDVTVSNQRFRAEEGLVTDKWRTGNFTAEGGKIKLTDATENFQADKLEKPGYSVVVDLLGQGFQTFQISRVTSTTVLKLKEKSNFNGAFQYRIDQETVLCGFEEDDPITVKYPTINLDMAKQKGRYIQFLEQAFEWQQIAYVFYPYFWAAEKEWLKLMNRLDYTDNNMTAFLKAGSVRVLIAATPGYNDAVMHFLATREPWEGGSLPVIGDPLFIPVYEEIRKQQDDLQNATPEGEAWEFEVPTSLIYLHDSSSPLPTDLKCDEDKETGETDDNTQETPNIFSCLGQLATCLCFHLRKGVISGYKQIFPE